MNNFYIQDKMLVESLKSIGLVDSGVDFSSRILKKSRNLFSKLGSKKESLSLSNLFRIDEYLSSVMIGSESVNRYHQILALRESLQEIIRSRALAA